MRFEPGSSHTAVRHVTTKPLWYGGGMHCSEYSVVFSVFSFLQFRLWVSRHRYHYAVSVFHLTQDVTYVVLLITSDKVARSMECLSEQRSQKNHENGIFRILCQDLMIRLVCFIRALYFDCTTLIYHGQCPSACCLSVASRSSIKTYNTYCHANNDTV